METTPKVILFLQAMCLGAAVVASIWLGREGSGGLAAGWRLCYHSRMLFFYT
ncbi:MAG: hypothetical protein ACNYPG_00795 [Candidatus Porifericomitaceae bacterium WSBS_2022_MAG_OTU9]